MKMIYVYAVAALALMTRFLVLNDFSAAAFIFVFVAVIGTILKINLKD
jgi:hypothetical protein